MCKDFPCFFLLLTHNIQTGLFMFNTLNWCYITGAHPNCSKRYTNMYVRPESEDCPPLPCILANFVSGTLWQSWFTFYPVSWNHAISCHLMVWIQLWIHGRGMNCFQNKNKTKCVSVVALCQWAKICAIATAIVSLECQAIYEERITGRRKQTNCITTLQSSL